MIPVEVPRIGDLYISTNNPEKREFVGYVVKVFYCPSPKATIRWITDRNPQIEVTWSEIKNNVRQRKWIHRKKV